MAVMDFPPDAAHLAFVDFRQTEFSGQCVIDAVAIGPRIDQRPNALAGKVWRLTGHGLGFQSNVDIERRAEPLEEIGWSLAALSGLKPRLGRSHERV
ncbi:MAG: hypothetical protein ACXU82_18005 [Caulobacteraceae bacterium]